MITIGSLFSGIGGLEMGLQAAGCGPILWQCDADPVARAVLAAHHPGVKIFDDVRDIDARTAQPVGLVCGGFPCQPHSLAGRRRGTADTRWLWPEFQRVVEVLGPPLVFIENVPGLRTSGLRDVLAGLAALGFDAVWDCFSAAEVGAPHIRRRLFILAYADSSALRLQPRGRRGSGREEAAVAGRDGVAGDVADAAGAAGGSQAGSAHGGSSGAPLGAWAWDWSRGGRGVVANPDGQGQLLQAPRLLSGGDWFGDGGGTWPTEPDVGRVAHGVPARAHRLRLLGNACVPAQAALAFRSLAARAAA